MRLTFSLKDTAVVGHTSGTPSGKEGLSAVKLDSFCHSLCTLYTKFTCMFNAWVLELSNSQLLSVLLLFYVDADISHWGYSMNFELWWVGPLINYALNKQCALNKNLHLTTKCRIFRVVAKGFEMVRLQEGVTLPKAAASGRVAPIVPREAQILVLIMKFALLKWFLVLVLVN